MSVNIGLNIITNVKDDHTVSVSASSGATLTSVSSDSFNSTKRLTASATENVAKELCTVTFTAGTNLYYSNEPDFIKNLKNSSLSITSSVTTNSLGRVTAKTFTISLTASTNSLYNTLSFQENIEVSSVSGPNNSVLKQIDSIKFNKSNVNANGETRQITVFGKENSKFSLKLTRSSDSKTYNFETNTFTTAATTSSVNQITSSGIFNTNIVIPSTSVFETYTLETTADFSNNTTMISSLRDEGSVVANSFTFNQNNNVTVTITCVSSDSSYSGTGGSLPSFAVTGVNGEGGKVEYVTLSPSLASKAFKKARNIEITDFESRTTATHSDTTGASATEMQITSSNAKILPGMTVTGTGISNNITVRAISGTTITLSGGPGGTISDGTTLTFSGGGLEYLFTNSGLNFNVTNLTTEDTGADLTINTVNKTANANSSGTTVTLANAEDAAVNSVVGIYEGVSTMAGVDAEGVTVTTVDSGQNTIVINADRTIKSGQVLTFTGAGRVAEISFQLDITKFPTENTTVNLNLDNFLTIDPGWS